MYGYRRTSENGLMTNLNSISSSLSSIDTVGRSRGNKSAKSSVDNLLPHRSQMTATTSAWWKNHPKEEQRYSTAASLRNYGERSTNQDHYSTNSHHPYGQRRPMKGFCLGSTTALNITLSILLLLNIVRQTFDFLGQIWLQILITYFTILIIIVALFGIRQNRISYLVLFIFWSIFNVIWNLLVISIHFKVRDINLSEDLLSLYTGGMSWWKTNGPGCLPYSITASLHQSVSILKPNIITGCRFDHHLLESAQAAVHSALSIISLLLCCYVAFSIHRNSTLQGANKANKSYRLNELTNGRLRVNPDPFPISNTSRFVTENNTLRRAANKVSSRSSQHSMTSRQSERRRARHLAENGNGPTPRGSTSSMQRSQKYGSLSSRRSASNRRNRIGGDLSSLTYGTTSSNPRGSVKNQRTRLSSLSSTDYLPSYQPPHSSNANLLSSYGEISSIDSYNNAYNNNQTANRDTRGQHRMRDRGNTNQVYNGSRSSVCSQNLNTNTNNNNYDDISNVYGVNTNNKTGVYGVTKPAQSRPN